MTSICVEKDFLLGLLEEVGKSRALAPAETDIVQAIVEQDTDQFSWTPEPVKDLQAAAATGFGVRKFARRNGLTDGQAYQKLYRVRFEENKRKPRKISYRKKKGQR